MTLPAVPPVTDDSVVTPERSARMTVPGGPGDIAPGRADRAEAGPSAVGIAGPADEEATAPDAPALRGPAPLSAAAVPLADVAASASVPAAPRPEASSSAAEPAPAIAAAATRKRPKPGERRIQILQTLARMLEQPGGERVTTAALATQLAVSEAALYRHFASKAQMFEGLIDFIEQSVFTLIQQIAAGEDSGRVQAQRIVTVVLHFGEKNPGMTRVMVGDALVNEHERLLARMNQFFDRIESQLRISLRAAAEQGGSEAPTADAQARASALTAFVVGRLQRHARSGFRRHPTEHLEASLRLFLPAGGV